MEGASVEGIHRSYDLSGMLPLGGPGEAGAPGVHDLVESTVDGENEGSLEESVAPGSCHQDCSEFLKYRSEVASSYPQVVQL